MSADSKEKTKSKKPSGAKATAFKRPSIVLRGSEGDEISVGEGKTVFDFSQPNLVKTPVSSSKEMTVEMTSSPLGKNNLQIRPRPKRRLNTSIMSTSGSDSEEATTDITDITLSADDLMERRPRVGGLPFLTSPPPALVDPTIPGVSAVSRWEETYTDKDRAAAVVKGTKDIKVSLLMKRKEEIRRMMPEEKGARVFYGQGVFQHKRHGPGQSATKYFDTALAMQPHSSICYLARSRCFLESGNTRRALEDANIVLTSEPNSPKALGLIAEAFYQLGDFEQALLHYHRAAALRTGDEKYILGVAKCKRAICNAIGNRKNGTVKNAKCKSNKTKVSKPLGEGLVSTTKSINDDVNYLTQLLKDKAIVSQKNNTSNQILQIASEALEYLNERRTFWYSGYPSCLPNSTETTKPSKKRTSVKLKRRKKTGYSKLKINY